jgi:hypothetical protein
MKIEKPDNHLVVRLRNRQPELNPFTPTTNIPDFTYKRGKMPAHR